MSKELITYLNENLKNYAKATDEYTRRAIRFISFGAVAFACRIYPEDSFLIESTWGNNYREKFGF